MEYNIIVRIAVLNYYIYYNFILIYHGNRIYFSIFFTDLRKF